MSDPSDSYPNAPPTLLELKRECHDLIEQVARRPGAIKLLLGTRNQLRLFSQYKAGRNTGDRLTRPSRD